VPVVPKKRGRPAGKKNAAKQVVQAAVAGLLEAPPTGVAEQGDDRIEDATFKVEDIKCKSDHYGDEEDEDGAEQDEVDDDETQYEQGPAKRAKLEKSVSAEPYVETEA
jgi:hypothetical protein